MSEWSCKRGLEDISLRKDGLEQGQGRRLSSTQQGHTHRAEDDRYLSLEDSFHLGNRPAFHFPTWLGPKQGNPCCPDARAWQPAVLTGSETGGLPYCVALS